MAQKVLTQSDSHTGLRNKLQAAITDKHGSGSQYSYMGDASVHDVFPGKVVHSIAKKPGKLFASPYKLEGGETGAVSLGEPQAVEPAYKPISEAAQGFIGEASVEFTEAAYDKSTGRLKITVIKPGFNTSKSRFYPTSTLKRDHKIFEGAKMFKNHQTAAESKARPEGSVDDYVADLLETSIGPDGSIVGVAQVHDPAWKEKLAVMQESGSLKNMGISIRAAGLQQEAEMQGVKTMFVESFTKAKSVDFVTFPGAGGRVEVMESENEKDDIDYITVERLGVLRPDIVKHFTEAAQEAATVAKTVEQLEAELRESQEANVKLVAAQNKGLVAGKLITMLEATKLPEASKKRIKAQFAEATEEKGIAEAISAEEAYVAELGITAKPGTGKVRHMGESHSAPVAINESDEKAKFEANVRAWKQTGMSQEAAEQAAANLTD